MRHILVTGLAIGAAIALGACSSPEIRLYHPRTGMVATCNVDQAVAMSQSANERCARDFEQQGYVRGAPPPSR